MDETSIYRFDYTGFALDRALLSEFSSSLIFWTPFKVFDLPVRFPIPSSFFCRLFLGCDPLLLSPNAIVFFLFVAIALKFFLGGAFFCL